MTSLQQLQGKFLPLLKPEDFFLLVAHATNKEKVWLLTHPEYVLSDSELTYATQFFTRRLAHEPVALIIGHKEFYGRDFLVTPDTLVPRPETELLVEHVLESIRSLETNNKHKTNVIDIIDIGTGSGNIIITLAKELETTHSSADIRYQAVDISRGALAVAAQNAGRHAVSQNILFRESNLLTNIPSAEVRDHHLIITANLPYLSTDIYMASDQDVRRYEPKNALESGQDGLDHYTALLASLGPFVAYARSSTLFMEISPEQTPLLAQIIKMYFPQSTHHIIPDLTGRDRLVVCLL